MSYEIKIIDTNMGICEYQMYQDIPSVELGSSNEIKDKSFEEYKEILKKYKKFEKELDLEVNSTTNRYIFYVDGVPVGEIGIRTTINDFWLNRGSQIFYKIRKSYRNMGYGTMMLKLGLLECKRMGMKSVCLNCNDKNIASKRVILKNDGKLLFNYGDSSRYEINL